MRVMLLREVFTGDRRLELLVLLWLGSVGRHCIVPDPLESDERAEWERALDDDTRRLWREMIDDSILREQYEPARHEIALTNGRDPAWERPTPLVPVGLALDLLLQPYRILLENSVYDRAFVLALCGRAERLALEEAERRAWLVFEMGGGSMVVPRVREIQRSPSLRRMASALIDSDAMRPRGADEHASVVEGKQAREVREAAGDPEVDGVHHHVLRRRSIENYIPVVALRRWAANPDKERVVRAFEKMSDAQRHHYNLKGGFNADAPNAARAGDLYSPLSANARGRLAQGFGKEIAKLFARTVKEEDLDAEAREEVREFVSEVLARMR